MFSAKSTGRLGFWAVAGATYHLAVDGAYGAFGNVALSLVVLPPVDNDPFAGATVLSGTNVLARGSNVGATKEPGEPDHAFATGGQSVWWRWTAPFSGEVALHVQKPDFESLLGVYTGESVTNLSSVLEPNFFTFPRFTAESGKTYYIAIDGWNGGSGEIELRLQLFPPPTNDLFANRHRIFGEGQTLSGSLLSATTEPGEPDHAGFPGGRSIWWSWTAPFTGGAVLRFAPGDFGFRVGVYSGQALPDLSEVARSDEWGFVSFRAVEGVAYHIAVDGDGEEALDFMLELTLSPAVQNDRFVDALNLSGETVVVRGSNAGATRELGEPNHLFTSAAHSIWWNWTAPFSGGAELLNEEPDFEIRIGVYTGSAVDRLSPVRAASSFAGTRFRAVAGTTYRIAVDGWNRETGNFSFRLRLHPPPVNDRFQNATPVLGTIAALRGTTFGASKEPGEPNHAGQASGQSVWWRWTAPSSGGVEFTNPQGLYQLLLGVYTGDSVDALTLVAQSRGAGVFAFRAVEGATYYFAVDSEGGAALDVFLHLRVLPPVANDQFRDAIPIAGASTRVRGSNVGATTELGEPRHAGYNPTRSVWWSWTAPFSGRAHLSTAGSDFSAVVGIYTGSAVTGLTEVTTADAVQSLPFRTQGGRTYHIAVDGLFGSSGEIVLRLELGPCTDQITVSNALDSGPGSLRQAIVDVCPGGIIEFHPSLIGQSILVTSGPLAIDKNLTIAGPEPGQLAVSAQSRNAVFEIVRGAVTISGLTIQNGFSQFGGGIINHGRLTLARCLLTANQASFGGGGIFNNFTASLTILDSTLSTNSAPFGGAFYNAGQAVVLGTTIGPANLAFAGGGYYGTGDLAMTNSTVAANVASRFGGGLAGERRLGGFNPIPSRTMLASCTVAENTAHISGGGYAQSSEADLELWNTLIARNNSAANPDLDRFRPVASQGHNLIGVASNILGWTNTDLIGTVAAPLDPLLGPLQNNGGPTFTLALAHNSPAVNQGDPNFTGPPFTDQRGPGFIRVVGRIDIGAWERQNESPRLSCSPGLVLACAAPSGTPGSLAITIQDPDGDELHVTWTVNGTVARTNVVSAGAAAEPLVVDYTALFGAGDSVVVVAVSDGVHVPAFCTNNVTVQDTVPPSLQLVGANPLTNLNLTFFVDPGAQASDGCAGDLTSHIVVRGPSDLTVPGQYDFVYTVTDPAGNTTTATRRVVIISFRDVQQAILADLVALRATVTDRTVLKKLDDAWTALTETLNPAFWADPTHLQRRHGEKAFVESRKAVDRLLGLRKDASHPVLSRVLEDLVERIVRAMRSVAAAAIHEGRQAGGDQARIDQAQEELDRGDSNWAEGKPDRAIDSYKHAWKTAVGASVDAIVRAEDGSIRLEIGGFPGETYAIQASTNLLHWETIAARTADPTGVIHFRDVLPGKARARFYRLLSSPATSAPP